MTFLNGAMNAPVNNAAQHARNSERSIGLALQFSRMLIAIGIIDFVSALIIWLLSDERYWQPLALAGVGGVIVAGGGLYRILPSATRNGIGLGLMLMAVPIALGLLLAFVPSLLPAVAAGVILISVVSQTLLGSRWGAVFTLVCLLALILADALAQPLSANLLDAPINREYTQSSFPLLGNAIAVLGFILIVRQLLIGNEAAADKEQAAFRMLIDNLPDYLFVKDQDSRMVINNVAHARVLGNSTPDQVRGKTDFDFFPPDLAQKYYDDEQQIIKSGESKINIEEITVDPQGKQHWLLTSKIIIHDKKGTVVGTVGISRDITAIKIAEQERDHLLRVEQEQRAGLETLVRQLRDTIQRLSAATGEILSAATHQASSMTEQEAVLIQTLSTVEEIRATVGQTAERTQSVSELSKQSVSVARKGLLSANDTVNAMTTIRQRMEAIAQTILMLSQRMQQIGEIVNTVNEIADQSKLLALNASIEAARAGNEGRGFAVVAAEVRQLADQSREATARVGKILNEIQQATVAAVTATKEGRNDTDSGVILVEQAGQSIQNLAAAIEEAASAASQIAASTHQQTNGMAQLAVSMGQIRETASETTNNVRQMERSVQDLMALARQLEKTAEQYAAVSVQG